MATLSQIYKSFEFTPLGQQTLVLHGALESLDHEIPIRLATFEYLKRNGGEVEPMGAGQKKFSYKCSFVGPASLTKGGPQLTPGSRYNQLVAAIIQQPRGQLIDPRLGKVSVGCLGLKAHEEPARAVDMVDFTISFAEDSVDVALAAESQVVPQQQGGRVLSINTEFGEAVDVAFSAYLYSKSAVITSVIVTKELLTTASASFVSAATAAAQTDIQDLSLVSMLGAVQIHQTAFISALAASFSFTLLPSLALTGLEVQARSIYAENLRLYYAVQAQKPPLVSFTLPIMMTLNVLLTRLYGKTARAKKPGFLLLNRVPSPFAIPGGRSVLIEAPTILQ